MSVRLPWLIDVNWLFNSVNRFGPVEDGLMFDGITELHLNETLLSWEEVCCALRKYFVY